MDRVLKGIVALFALLFTLLGLRWMFTPYSMAPENGLELLGTLGPNTARGDIGGMFVAGAALMVIGLVRNESTWLRAVALLTACIAVGRSVGMSLDGFASSSLVPFMVEIVMVVVLWTTARRMDSGAAARR